MHQASSTRPQLTREQAERFHYLEVMKYTGAAGAETKDPWDPLLDRPMTGGAMPKADYVVPADGTRGGIQRAINAAVRDALAQGRTERIYIELAKGVHKGLVYVPQLVVSGVAVPFTIFGAGAGPEDTHLVDTIDAEISAREYCETFGSQFIDAPDLVACIFNRISARNDIITTANASVVRVQSAGFQLRNLSVTNAYEATRAPVGVDPATLPRNAKGQITTGQHQAVAVLIAGADKVHLDTVRLSSFQDTLYFQSPEPAATVRSFYSNCFIEGDVDFIFGQSTAFFTKCEIRLRGSRAKEAWATAPSTNVRTRYGIVFDDCDFTHDSSENALKGIFSLGRQWFEGVRCTPYGKSPVDGYSCELGEVSRYDPPSGTISRATLEAVGKCVVMRSRIARHINKVAPWCDWNGGTHSADGTFEPGPWHPRYRPTQYTASDFLTNLENWKPAGALDISDIDPSDVFLAEFENTEV